MRGAVRAGLILGTTLGLVGMPPSTSAAQTSGSFTVTPDTGLLTGDTVTIEGSGYAPNAQVAFCQAHPEGEPDQSDCGKAFEITTTDENGDFSANYQVLRFITRQFAAPDEVDCRAVTCGIGVAEVDPSPVPGTVSFQPITFDPEPIVDLILKRRSDGQLFFDNVYEPIGSRGFRVHKSHTIAAGGTWTYALRIQNDGEVTDDFVVTAPENFSPFALRFCVGYFDVTAEVIDGGLTFADVDPGETLPLAVQFAAPPESTGSAETMVTVRAGAHSLISDTLRLHVFVP